MRGAGGTSGGQGQFFMGVLMFTVGLYLFFSNIIVTNSFGMGTAIFRLGSGGGFQVTTGYILVPFIFGIGMIFFERKNILGWTLAVLSIAALFFGVVTSFQFVWRSMSAFDTLVVLVLTVGGLGMFLRSLTDRKGKLF